MGSLSVKKFFENNWEKMALWAILIGLFYLLKPFFLLIFETFLITFITKNIVLLMVKRWKINHKLCTVVVFIFFLGFGGFAGALIGPKIIIESNRIVADFAGKNNLQTRDNIHLILKNTLIKIVGEDRTNHLLDSKHYGLVKDAVKMEITKASETMLPRVLEILLNLIKTGWQVLITLLLAILLSFILVLDWKEIAMRMKALETSRIRTFYLGAIPHLNALATVLGKAFSAQAIIAICNTILTAIGLFIFGVPNAALLSSIVFICGFIPIIGTFISSVPILLFGLQFGGVLLAFKLLIVISTVHVFEAYILNPKITSGFFHVHPILILVLLIMGERFFGVWGMVVGVPVGYYLITVLTAPDENLSVSQKD